MALLVVLSHQDMKYQLSMLQQKLFHARAMVVKFLQDSHHLVAVLEMSREQIDIKNDFEQWYASR